MTPGGDLADVLHMGHDADTARHTTEQAAAAAMPATPPTPAIPNPKPQAQRRSTPHLICMADVQPTDVRWLWPGRIPLGRMTLLVGRPGLGKSFLTAYMAATVSRGSDWTDGSTCPAGSVVLCSAEDDPADTLAPRLIAHSADTSRIHALAGVMLRDDDDPANPRRTEKVFTLADIDTLRDTLEQLPDVRLIVVDPIGSYLGGGADAHRDNEVRGVLAPACKLAADHDAALLVVAHNRKSAAAYADDTAMGSRAFTGLARCVFHLLPDPDDDTEQRRLFLPGKNNLAERPAGLAFDIGAGDVPTLDGNGRPCIRWHEGTVDITADEAVNREPTKPDAKQTERDEAQAWLRQTLAAGARPAKDIVDDAKNGQGISKRTLERAKKELGVDAYRPVNPGTWWWRLPHTHDTNTPTPDPHCHNPQGENVGGLAVCPDDPVRADCDDVCDSTSPHRHTANPLANGRPAPTPPSPPPTGWGSEGEL